MEQDPNHLAGETARRPVAAPLFFAVVALFFVAAAAVLRRYAIPWIAEHVPPERVTDILRQTLLLRLIAARIAAVFALAAAVIAFRVPTARWRGVAIIGPLLALGLAMRLSWPDLALDLSPRPDAIQLAASAQDLVTHLSLRVPTGTEMLPARTLPGPSLLMAATAWLDPRHPGMGVWPVVLCGLLSVWVAYKLGHRFVSLEAGLAAALLIALSPVHGYFSRLLMGGVPWGLIVLGSIYLLLGARGRPVRLVLSGLLMGAGLLFKSSHLLIVAGALLFVLVYRRRLRELLGGRDPLGPFAAGLVLGILPALLYTRFVLGGWLRTPYHLYWPGWASATQALNWRYLWHPPLIRGSMGNAPYYLLSFLGFDLRPERLPLVFPGLFLVAAGAMQIRRHGGLSEPARLLLAAVGWTTVFYAAACLLYSFQDTRFFLPVLPLWYAAAGVPLAALGQAVPAGLRKAAGGLALVIAAACALAIPLVETAVPRTPERVVQQRLAAAMKDFDVLVSDADPVLLTEFGSWNRHTALVPLLLPGELWFPPDPAALFREKGVVVEPFPGTVRRVHALQAEGKRFAVWIRKPHYRPAAHAAFLSHFRLEDRPGYGVPGLREIVPGPATVPVTAHGPGDPARDGHRPSDGSLGRTDRHPGRGARFQALENRRPLSSKAWKRRGPGLSGLGKRDLLPRRNDVPPGGHTL